MSVAKRILSNTAIQIIGKVITAAISIAIIKAITSLETIPGLEGLPSEYKLIYTYLTFFGIIADFGLFTIAVREMSQHPDEQESILGNILGMRMVTIILTMSMASLLVLLIPAENYTLNVKIGVLLAAITTFLTMMASTTSSILQVHLRMAPPTIALMIGKVLMAAYILFVVWNFQSIPHAFYHLLGAGIAGSFVTYIITYIYTKKFLPFKLRYDPIYWKKVFKEALPYGLAIILSTIYFKVDVLLISFLRPKHEIAIYGFPSSVVELLSIFPIYFMNSTLPTLSRAYKESRTKTKKILQLSFIGITAMSLPMVVGGLILARPMMQFIMNDSFLTGNVLGYYGSDVAFQLLLFPTLFAFINTLFSFSLIAIGEQGKLLKINAIGVTFNIITNLIFIPTYGFVAAGITTIISEAIILLLTYREFRKTLDSPIQPFIFLGILTMALVMGLFVYLNINNLPIIPLIGLGGIIYILLLIPLARKHYLSFKSEKEFA